MIGEGFEGPNNVRPSQGGRSGGYSDGQKPLSRLPTPSKQAGNQVRLSTAWLVGLKKRPCTQSLSRYSESSPTNGLHRQNQRR
jgi:hypothetical protein